VSADQRNSGLRTSLVTFVVLLIALFGAYLFGASRSSRGLSTALEERVREEQLVSDMLINLHASAEAEKRAVMAETDEASKTYAQEAQRKSTAVEDARRELTHLISLGNQPEEVSLVNEFNTAWTEYQALDREILGLAVENTNLKALRLSFGPASDALDRLEAALKELVARADSHPDRAGISKAAFQAVVAALKILALQNRHIAKAGDEEMDRIEGEMRALDKQASNELDKLSTSSGEALQADAARARAAYTDFQEVHSQILDLSRRNSNIRSLALSLGKKRMATAKCTELLTALQTSIRSERFTDTR
jgi:Four helix bundle sensory module for signal transduction